MANKEVAVCGAGPGGISAVLGLAKLDHKVTWLLPDSFVEPRSVYTTTTESSGLMEHIKDSETQSVPYLRLANENGADVMVNVGTKYFMVDNVAFITRMVNLIKDTYSNVNLEKNPRHVVDNIQVTEEGGKVLVKISDSSKKFDAVIDATGPNAHIMNQVDRRMIGEQGKFVAMYLYGAKFKGKIQDPAMILAMGGQIGTSWISPSAEPGYIDIVYNAWGPSSDYKTRFLPSARKRLEELVKFARNLPGVEFEEKTYETYVGVARAQPTAKPLSKNVFSLGESAGMARPTTGQSFDRAFRAGDMLATVIDKEKSPQFFYKTWRKIWKDDLFLAGTLARLPYQKKGEVGGTVTVLHDLAKSGKHEKVIDSANKWFVDGKISAQALAFLLSNPKLLLPYLEVLRKYMEIKLKNDPIAGLEWSLPEV